MNTPTNFETIRVGERPVSIFAVPLTKLDDSSLALVFGKE